MRSEPLAVPDDTPVIIHIGPNQTDRQMMTIRAGTKVSKIAFDACLHQPIWEVIGGELDGLRFHTK
jgi:hypothetical protein